MTQEFDPKDMSSPEYWEFRYRSGQTGWDLGGPTPVFQNWLAEHPGNREAVCLPGAGNGYDAVAFARAGYVVTAVEFAPMPARALAQQGDELRLALTVLEQDIFQLPGDHAAHFDLVVEYTVYCAIDPRRRDEYVTVLASILKPSGALLALFFPVNGDSTAGPPFGVGRAEIKERFGTRFRLLYEEWPEHSVPGRRRLELLMYMEKL